MKKFFFWLAFSLPYFVLGNFVSLDNKTTGVSLDGFCYNIEDINNNLTIDSVLTKKWNYLAGGPKFGYSPNYQWVKYELKNTSDTNQEFFLYIPYSHINRIDFYFTDNNTVVDSLSLGTAIAKENKPIDCRGYPFKFNLKSGEKRYLILRLDHRFLPLRASSFIMSEQQLKETISESESLIWFWRGIFIFALIVSLILYFSVRLKLFLYYFLFNTGVLVFIGTEIGDFFHFFSADKVNHISDLKHIGNYIVVYFFPLFLNELTPLKKLNQTLWKWMYWFTIPLMFIIPIGFLNVTKNTFFYMFIDMYMLIDAVLILLLQLVFLFPAIKNREKNSIVLFVTYAFYISAVIVNVILPAVGLTTESPKVHSTLLTGSIFEIFTFLLLMGREAIGVYKERANLLEKQKYHQREMLLAVVQSQEKERNRVGRELHDMVGANMSIIKQNIPEDNQLKEIISDTIESVRSLSHGLVTPRVSSNEFIDEITELCLLASNDDFNVYPYFHNWKEIDNNDINTHLFRIIQELIQNAIKHSEAMNVYVQLIYDNSIFSVMYEDDGVGFNTTKAKKRGQGLLGIENRVQLINGNINYDSAYKGKGTTITIDFRL